MLVSVDRVNKTSEQDEHSGRRQMRYGQRSRLMCQVIMCKWCLELESSPVTHVRLCEIARGMWPSKRLRRLQKAIKCLRNVGPWVYDTSFGALFRCKPCSDPAMLTAVMSLMTKVMASWPKNRASHTLIIVIMVNARDMKQNWHGNMNVRGCRRKHTHTKVFSVWARLWCHNLRIHSLSANQHCVVSRHTYV